MRDPAEYVLEVLAHPGEAAWDRLIEEAYRCVFRTHLSQPGFAVLNLPPDADSRQLRRAMVELKRTLADRILRATGRRLAFQSVGRFDQQHTTKPHRDNAPAQSILMLGYEPTPVRSQFFIADYTACAAELGMSPDEFLAVHNPMYAHGQQLLGPYTTELADVCGRRPQIVLVNNSSMPLSSDREGLLGVLHHAVIPHPARDQRRIINSTMLVFLDADEDEPVDPTAEDAFVATDRISESAYA